MQTTLERRPEPSAPLAAAKERRQEPRKAVLKRAQVVFGDAAIQCIVENMSTGGARLRFGNPIALPETVSLRFPDGESHPAEIRWAQGDVAGIRFLGAGPLAEADRRHMVAAVKDAVVAADPGEAVRLLHQIWFFGDERVRKAAETLQIAQARFLAAVDPHLAGANAATPVFIEA